MIFYRSPSWKVASMSSFSSQWSYGRQCGLCIFMHFCTFCVHLLRVDANRIHHGITSRRTMQRAMPRETVQKDEKGQNDHSNWHKPQGLPVRIMSGLEHVSLCGSRWRLRWAEWQLKSRMKRCQTNPKGTRRSIRNARRIHAGIRMTTSACWWLRWISDDWRWLMFFSHV